MNIVEGASRMQRSGRALVILSLSIFTLAAILAGGATFLPSYFHLSEFVRIVLPILFTVIWVCAIALVIGGLLWIGSWILEGFMHHTH